MWGFSAASEGAAGGMRVRSRAPGLPMSPPRVPMVHLSGFLPPCLSEQLCRRQTERHEGLQASAALAPLAVSSRRRLLPPPASHPDPIFPVLPPGLTGSRRPRSGASAGAAVTYLSPLSSLVQANPEVAMDSIVHMTQHISPTQRAEIVRILSTMDSPSST